MKRIALIATLDTKGEEANYLKELILKHGHRVIMIDVGSGGPATITADITADEIARAGGGEIEELRASKERRQVIEVIIKGAIAKLKDLSKVEVVDGVVAIGGVSSTVLASSIMSELPFGIPKLIVSSGASMPGSNRFFGPTGITLMHSVFDIGGLNNLLKAQLGRAAGAICGMVEEEIPSGSPDEQKPMVAITTYGYTENCGRYVCEALKERYEPVSFHASGVPEIAMERLIGEGFFTGVIDLVPSSITNALHGGSRTSWPERLEIAGEKGIPQVVAPGGVNTISRMGFTADALATELKTRRHYFMDAQRVTVWLNTEEARSLASVYAEKLNRAVGPTKFLVPLRGWLSIEREGASFYDPRANKAFADELRKKLKIEIELREVDANIDDPAFAQAVVDAFEEVMKLKGG